MSDNPPPDPRNAALHDAAVQDTALKTPEPPSQEALSHDEGRGPFGADMTHLRGGIRDPSEAPEPGGSPYSTGTDPKTGTSLSHDPRATYDGHAAPGQTEDAHDEGEGKGGVP